MELLAHIFIALASVFITIYTPIGAVETAIPPCQCFGLRHKAHSAKMTSRSHKEIRHGNAANSGSQSQLFCAGGGR